MQEDDFFLKTIVNTNGDNTVLTKLNTSNVVFIDYKNISDKIINGVTYTSCVRLKTLPASGFVGSCRIYYSKINISKIYALLEDVLILINDNATIKDLLTEITIQTGITIESSFITNDLTNKLIFDNSQCGSIELSASDTSKFFYGSIKIRYTSNKYRVLNYIPNRLISFNENILTTNSYSYIVRPESYYFDLSNFPIDHELYQKVNLLNCKDLTDYFELLYKRNGYQYPRTTIDTAWLDTENFPLKQIIQSYLEYNTICRVDLQTDKPVRSRDEQDPKDYVPYGIKSTSFKDCSIVLSLYSHFYTGTTTGLVEFIKNNELFTHSYGNVGVNLNYKMVFSIISTTNNDIITFYWGLS